MHLIRGLSNLKTINNLEVVATIGNYDGVHRGHQAILSLVRQKARELQLPSMVIVFEPQPEEFFNLKERQPRLSSLREKLTLLRSYRIDNLLVLPFNFFLAHLTAERFISEIIVRAVRIRYLIVGDDFKFGYRRQGDFAYLMQQALGYTFQVSEVPTFRIDEIRVSSSFIRSVLQLGNFQIANKFLGHSYQVIAKVISGDGLGRRLGFPTANLYLPHRELPLLGIYLVKVYGLAPTALPALASIGFRPTVGGKEKRFEVYILDFNVVIYGKRIAVEFCQKIREEKKFNSLFELQEQIKQDVKIAREFFIKNFYG